MVKLLYLICILCICNPINVQATDIQYTEIEVTSYAYCLCQKCCGIWSKNHPTRINDSNYIQKTKSGTIPEVGRTIAVDSDIIPLGSKVEINGQIYIAEDIGGGINQYKIDILHETHEQALEYGKQDITIKIMNEV